LPRFVFLYISAFLFLLPYIVFVLFIPVMLFSLLCVLYFLISYCVSVILLFSFIFSKYLACFILPYLKFFSFYNFSRFVAPVPILFLFFPFACNISLRLCILSFFVPAIQWILHTNPTPSFRSPIAWALSRFRNSPVQPKGSLFGPV